MHPAGPWSPVLLQLVYIARQVFFWVIPAVYFAVTQASVWLPEGQYFQGQFLLASRTLKAAPDALDFPFKLLLVVTIWRANWEWLRNAATQA
jgi:hypothetical protein